MNQNIYFEDTQWKYNSSPFIIAILNENCSLRRTVENPSNKSNENVIFSLFFLISKKKKIQSYYPPACVVLGDGSMPWSSSVPLSDITPINLYP